MCTSTQVTAGARPGFWLAGARSLNNQLFALYFQTHRIFVLATARMLLHVAEFPFILIIFRLLHRVATVTPPLVADWGVWLLLQPFVGLDALRLAG